MEMKDLILPGEISLALDKVMEQSKPVSIFVYGSRARTDYKESSDFEVGALFNRDKKWGRSQLATLHDVSGLNIYPFVLEDFSEYKLDTPFPRAVYLRELMSGAKTIKGEKIIENMELPEIKISDLLEVATFQLAYALGAVLSSRQKDWVTTSIEFTKSALFGARALVVLEKGKFPLSYDDIYSESQNLELDEDSKTVIQHVIDLRKGGEIKPELLYKNLTFLNQIVYAKIKAQFLGGDRIILPGHPIA